MKLRMLINKLIIYIYTKIIQLFSKIIFQVQSMYHGIEYSSNLKVDGIINIKKSRYGSIVIGKNFVVNSRKKSNFVGITNRASFQVIDKGSIEIGNYCGFTSTVFSSRELIRIGNHVMIGANVRIFDHDYHSLNYLDRKNPKDDSNNVKSSCIFIEDDVFIGTNSIILKGVHIGARSIIGAGSVVSIKKIPPDSIVAGNPARVLIQRSK